MYSFLKVHYGKIIIHILCLLFIISGALNYGWTRWTLSIPFMMVFIFIGKKLNIFFISLGVIILAIVCNYTLEKNPFIFPILNEGEVTFLSDGHILIYNDDSGGFRSDIRKPTKCIGCGETRNIPVKKGQTTKVIGINIGHADMGTNVGLMTELGPISSLNIRGYGDGKVDVILNKPYKNEFIEYVSILMMYPTLPIMIPILFGKLF